MSVSAIAKYRWLAALVAVVSVGGIFFAVFITGNKEDGGRGGAIAVAIALFNLFISKGYGMRLFNVTEVKIPTLISRIEQRRKEDKAPVPAANKREEDKAPAPDTNKREGDQAPAQGTSKTTDLAGAISQAFDDQAKEQKQLNRYLAWTTLGATIVWGFGDLFAKWGIEAARHAHLIR